MSLLHGNLDYLDTLFACDRVTSKSHSTSPCRLPRIQRTFSRSNGSSATYADKIRDRVDNVKKTKDKKKGLSSSNVSELYRGTIFNDEIEIKRISKTVVNSSSHDRAVKAVLPHLTDSNHLKVYLREFEKCSRLLESFWGQLDYYFTSFHRLQCRLNSERSGSFNCATDDDYSIEKAQFLSLIIGLRNSFIRVAECYQTASTLFQRDRSESIVQSLLTMAKSLKMMIDHPTVTVFPEPFLSWLTVSPVRNIFFMPRRIDGTSAVLERSSTLKKDFFPFENSQHELYPSDLIPGKLEIGRMTSLGSFIWCTIQSLPDENMKVSKNDLTPDVTERTVPKNILISDTVQHSVEMLVTSRQEKTSQTEKSANNKYLNKSSPTALSHQENFEKELKLSLELLIKEKFQSTNQHCASLQRGLHRKALQSCFTKWRSQLKMEICEKNIPFVCVDEKITTVR